MISETDSSKVKNTVISLKFYLHISINCFMKNVYIQEIEKYVSWLIDIIQEYIKIWGLVFLAG